MPLAAFLDLHFGLLIPRDQHPGLGAQLSSRLSGKAPIAVPPRAPTAHIPAPGRGWAWVEAGCMHKGWFSAPCPVVWPSTSLLLMHPTSVAHLWAAL